MQKKVMMSLFMDFLLSTNFFFSQSFNTTAAVTELLFFSRVVTSNLHANCC